MFAAWNNRKELDITIPVHSQAVIDGQVPRVSTSVEYTGTPGPKGPRSAKLRRGFAASATNTPFLVPIVRMTRSANVNLLRPPAGS